MLLLGILVIATTLNDTTFLDEWLNRGSGILEQDAIEEAILQTLLFVGFPRTIEAMKQVREYFPHIGNSKQVMDHAEAGEATSKKIYGRYHSRLKEVMNELHPDLTRWMIEDGYGRVLSRTGLSLPHRELAVVASLMASGMINQYRAHLRGALYAGVKPDDIIWFTETFQCIIEAKLKMDFEVIAEKTLQMFKHASV